MKRIAMFGIIILMALTGTARAGGILQNKSDWGHLIAGMIIEKYVQDQQQKKEAEQQQQAEIARQQQELDRQKREHERNRPYIPPQRYDMQRDYQDNKDYRNKMKQLLVLHRVIVQDILEESDESEAFVLRLYERNGYDANRTSVDMKPFVYDYFVDEFGNNSEQMYRLWVSTKFTDWLESKYE